MVETKEFKQWHRVETARRLGAKTPEQLVEEQLTPGNLKIEVKDATGKWVDDLKA